MRAPSFPAPSRLQRTVCSEAASVALAALCSTASCICSAAFLAAASARTIRLKSLAFSSAMFWTARTLSHASLASPKRDISVQRAQPSVTQRALSVTQRSLSVTQRALSVSQRALSVTQRALSVTQRAFSVTQRALTWTVVSARSAASAARVRSTSTWRPGDKWMRK
jgi:hypothetical protein